LTGKEEVVRATVMANFTEIDEARKVLGLSETATLKEIKRAYRTLAHRHHPDKDSTKKDNDDMMKALNLAYKLLMDYCDNYKYSFEGGGCSEDLPRRRIFKDFQRQVV
jgi:DnaJ-class molecular chaperone